MSTSAPPIPPLRRAGLSESTLGQLAVAERTGARPHAADAAMRASSPASRLEPAAWSATVAPTITHHCVVDETTVRRVRTSFARCQRIANQAVDRRDVKRWPFEGQVFVQFGIRTEKGQHAHTDNAAIPLWGRDIATYGMSFLASRLAFPVQIHDNAPILRLDEWFKPGANVCIGLYRWDETLLWLLARMVRFQVSHEAMYDCGVEFVSRLT